MLETVHGSVNLPVFVTILFEGVPQEHQLGLQAIFIKKGSGSVYQSGKYRLFIGWVMVGLAVEVVGACGTICAPESHQVSYKYLCPGMGGGLHFRFPWRTEWLGGFCLDGEGSPLVCSDRAPR
jgi:hypothetical protein